MNRTKSNIITAIAANLLLTSTKTQSSKDIKTENFFYSRQTCQHTKKELDANNLQIMCNHLLKVLLIHISRFVPFSPSTLLYIYTLYEHPCVEREKERTGLTGEENGQFFCNFKLSPWVISE